MKAKWRDIKGFFKNQFIEIPRRSIIGCFLKFLSLVAKAGLNRTLFEISAGIFKQSMGARKRVVIGLSYHQATQPGGIGSLESILGLLLKFKNSGSGVHDRPPAL